MFSVDDAAQIDDIVTAAQVEEMIATASGIVEGVTQGVVFGDAPGVTAASVDDADATSEVVCDAGCGSPTQLRRSFSLVALRGSSYRGPGYARSSYSE